MSNPSSHDPIRKILRGSAWLTASSTLSKIVLLVFFVFLANRLGKENLGRFQFLLDSAFVVFVCTDLGLGFLLVQRVSREREQTPHLLARFLGLRTAMIVPFTLFYILFLFFYGRFVRHSAWDLPQTLAVTYLVLHTAWDLFRSVLRGWERMDLEALSMLLERLVYMGLGTLLLLAGYRLGGMMLVAQLSITCSFTLIVFWIVRNGTTIRIRWELSCWPQLIRDTLPFGLGALCIVVLYREDTLMLNWLKGDGETGIYTTAFRLMEGTLLIPQAVALSAYPTFSRIFHEGGSQVRPQAEKLQRWLLIFCLPVMTGGILLAPKILGLFNPEYLASTHVLQLLLVALPALYLNYLVGTLLRSVDRQKLNLISAVVALVANFCLNLLLIPPLGASGAALATVLTQLIYFLMMYRFLRGAIGGLRIRAYFIVLCLCSLVMGGVLYPLQSMGLYLTIPLGMVVFFAAAFLTRLISREDLREFFSLLRRGQS